MLGKDVLITRYCVMLCRRLMLTALSASLAVCRW